MKIKVKTQIIINIADCIIASEAYIRDTRTYWRCNEREVDFCKVSVGEIKREM